LVGGVGGWGVDGGPQEVIDRGGAAVTAQGGGFIIRGADDDMRRIAVGLAEQELGDVTLSRRITSVDGDGTASVVTDKGSLERWWASLTSTCSYLFCWRCQPRSKRPISSS
jgi:hypothetical protein